MALPLYAAFAFSFSVAEIAPQQVLFLAFISPFGEELIFRAFAFGF
jgi:membrane protease YdiL (CAAX protease family)